jgi:hypothetical protein
MVLTDVQNMAGITVEDKAFIAFERRSTSPQVSGVYFNEFDRITGTAAQNFNVIATAPKVIDGTVYNNANLDRIFLYANKAGTDITITLITTPDASGTSFVHTGRIIGGNQYQPCSAPAQVQGTLSGFFGFYYDNNTKNKFYLFQTAGGTTFDMEAH